ncbi:MAG TPA: type II toxin-antitoxin system RelE/ParE family toxin [Candidatus Baltobacteraceae bacterium]|nr:type II toxin-antitoxin system RelE/ParE family toxin [Candidatus Baltobacteraceae bacterium]
MSRRIVWLGDSQDALTEASEGVRQTMGGALRAAQEGTTSDDAVPMKGKLSDVMEVREDDEAGTWRCMYTVQIDDAVYVLDFFQKKSTKGIATPKADLDRIEARLKQARRLAAQETKGRKK